MRLQQRPETVQRAASAAQRNLRILYRAGSRGGRAVYKSRKLRRSTDYTYGSFFAAKINFIRFETTAMYV